MGLLDLLKQNTSPATSGIGQMSEAEIAALKFKQMKAQIDEMSKMKQINDVGLGSLSDEEALRLMEAQRLAGYNGNGISNMSNQETLRMDSLKNALPYSLYRPYGAYASPQNTMQNIDPTLGGMTARNTQPPMDINMLLRMLGR